MKLQKIDKKSMKFAIIMCAIAILVVVGIGLILKAVGG